MGTRQGEYSAKDIDACHRGGKQGRFIVKYLRRKYFQQVLSVKKDVQAITTTDLYLPNTTIKFYLNESLCPHCRGQKVKHLQ